MDLKAYFDKTGGTGVLSTADDKGKVNAAIYARPHVLENGHLAFIMRDRLTHHNLTTNPHAAFLFREEGSGYRGIRLHLSKSGEEENSPLVKELCRRCKVDTTPNEQRFLVTFRIDKELPLVGAGEVVE